MQEDLKSAFSEGYARMAAWADLLDDINLYPVADADTGRNLRISLAPLRTPDHPQTVEKLLLSATGNSGNIACAFFSRLVAANSPENLRAAVKSGRDSAWQALLDPKPGTMLSVFDVLTDVLSAMPGEFSGATLAPLLEEAKTAVLSTADILPELKAAGVVDAGALGMFFFFEGFFKRLAGDTAAFVSPRTLFGERLHRAAPMAPLSEEGYCINALISPSASPKDIAGKLSGLGNSVVSISSGQHLKVHFHATDSASARADLDALGTVLSFEPEKIEGPITSLPNETAVHLVTDAAGSLTREAALALGITLLESYVVMEDRAIPETLVDPAVLYDAMRRGVKVTTAQASTFERRQYYESLISRYPQVAYLCVGSVYTGNHGIAAAWAAAHPEGRRMALIDSGIASGRLGLMARRAARMAASGKDLSAVVQAIKTMLPSCDELLFIDQLKYLAAGGRISKAKGFMGDLFHVKPVIRPGPQGVQKMGAVKTREAQIAFALEYLTNRYTPEDRVEFLLEYTDNQAWVESEVLPQIGARFPKATILTIPLSLTSGVHMGPGTWGLAFLPDEEEAAP